MTESLSDPFARLDAAEQTATEVLCYAETRIPGFLQHPMLIRALHAATHALHPLVSTAEELLARREASRSAARSPQREQTTVLLYEESLHRAFRAFGVDVASAQLDWLRPAVWGESSVFGEKTTVRVLPRSCGRHLLPGDFTIVRFADTADEQDFVYTEAAFGAAGGIVPRYLDSEWPLLQAWDTWQELLEEAHSGPELTEHRFEVFSAMLR